MSWFFERYAQMGGASAGAYRNTLAGVGVPPTDVFVREVLQNSVDAGDDGGSVRVVFREDLLEGDALDRFRAALDLGPDSPLAGREDLLTGLSAPALFEEPIRVLYVEDFDTAGLGGADGTQATSDEDNYRRLCLELGVTGEGDERGGTFGYGKAAYWATSDLWTVVFYSRFEASDRTAGVSSRLTAVSWLNEHAHRPEDGSELLRYTGRCWFGEIADSGDYCLPFVDQRADDLANTLGFLPRGPGDHGTSAMILGHNTRPDQIAEAVERNWWPRILEERLDVVLPDGSNPSPRTNTALRPFIRGWDLLSGSREPDVNDAVGEIVYRGGVLGRLAITTTDEGPSEGRHSRIALIRGPGMVVTDYQGPTSAVSQPFSVGVFRADPSMESALAASEPPAHDRWDYGTNRADRELTEADRRRIDNTLKKIRSSVRDFLRVHQEAPPEAPPRCKELEKVLGEFFATQQSGPPPPPPPGADIFSVQFSEPVTREIDETLGEVRLSATLSIQAMEEAFEGGEDSIVVWLTAWVDTLLDDGRSAPRGDRLMMTFMKADDPKDQDAVVGEIREHGTVAELLMTPNEGPWKVEVLSAPLPHPEYSAKLGVLVEKVDMR